MSSNFSIFSRNHRSELAAPETLSYPSDAYENSLRALVDIVSNVVFSRWGLGLAALTVTAGACFGSTAAVATFAPIALIFGFYSYFSWRFEQIPRFWHLSNAVHSGNLARVQTLLSMWERFEIDSPIHSFNVLYFDFIKAKNEGHREIALQILLKMRQIDPQNFRVESLFTDAAESNDRLTIELFIQAYRPVPAAWLDQSLLNASQKGHLEIVDLLLANRDFRAIPPSRNICHAIQLAKTNQISEKIETALLSNCNNFWQPDSPLRHDFDSVFIHACRHNRLVSINRMLSIPNPIQDVLGNGLSTAAHRNFLEIVRAMLASNLINNAQILSEAIFRSGRNSDEAQILREYAQRQNIRINE